MVGMSSILFLGVAFALLMASIICFGMDRHSKRLDALEGRMDQLIDPPQTAQAQPTAQDRPDSA